MANEKQAFGDKTPIIIQWGTLISILALIILGARWTSRIETVAAERWTSIDQQFFIEDLRNKNPDLKVCDTRDILLKSDVKRR